MEQRAQTLGFKPMQPETVEYLIVPGYVKPAPEINLVAPQPQLSAPSIPPKKMPTARTTPQVISGGMTCMMRFQ